MKVQRRAVAPVLATLMMIAVAVAMSVIIFVWSEGFLSSTSTAAGSQQSEQNIAAQSSISIEAVIFDTGTKSMTIVVRNVGSVSETIGSMEVQGIGTNTGFSGSDVCTSLSTSKVACSAGGSVQTTSTTLSKSTAVTVTYTASSLSTGDLINIKVTSTAGTFATQQFTVP